MNQTKILAVLLLLQSLYLVNSFILGIVNGVEYYVKNNGTNLCLAAGEMEGFIPGSLFARGTLLSEQCQKEDAPATPIQRNQWMVVYKDNHNLIDLTSGETARYYAKTLNANLTGHFIKYFQNFVHIKKLEVDNENQYMVKDSKSEKCLFSHGEHVTTGFSQCNSSETNQLWSFIIVQEPVNTNCSDFWGCRKSRDSSKF